MGGFGFGPFGQGYFGASRWAKDVLWNSLPETYRLADVENENIFERFMDGVAPSFDRLRGKIAAWEELRDPLRVRTQYDEEEWLRLGQQVTTRGDLLQKGIKGQVTAFRTFSTTNGRFTERDVGKDLWISGSVLEANNRVVRITSLVSGSEVLTDPILQLDSELRWELREHVEPEEGRITVQVRSGSIDSITPGWILYDGYSEYEVLARRHFRKAGPVRTLLIETLGEDGELLAGGYLQTSVAVGPWDVGKRAVVSGSSEPSNNGEWEVLEVTGAGPYVMRLDAPGMQADPGPVVWALWPFGELDLEADVPCRGVAVQAGKDLEIILPNRVRAHTGSFTTTDVGKRLEIVGSALGASGSHVVTALVTSNELQVATTFGSVETGLVWYLRALTGLQADDVHVKVSAPPLLDYLAQDFGITVDAREREELQRSWAYNVAGWVNIKGTAAGYASVGKLSGLRVEVAKLYRVSSSVFRMIRAMDPDEGFIVADSNERYGSDGQIVLGFFSAPSVRFRAGDVGKHVRVTNAAIPANEGGIFTIVSIVNETTVELLPLDDAQHPDYGLGGLVWSIVRLYAARAPTRPRMDDFIPDLLEEIVDSLPPVGDAFSVDRLCWEDDWSTDVPVVGVSVTPETLTTHRVVVATPVGQAGSADVILNVGNWMFYDAQGTQFYVESLPVEVLPGQFEFVVQAAAVPSLVGPYVPKFAYACDEILDCEWCASNKVSLRIELGPELVGASSLEVENIFQRALDRMEQAKPAHVEFVVAFRRTLPVTISHTVSMVIT